MAAAQARTSELALIGWFLTSDQNRASIRSDSIRPGHFRIGLGLENLAVGAVERVEKSVSICLDQSLHLAAIDGKVHRQEIADRIPIVHVVRGELVKPFQLSSVVIQPDYTPAIKIVAAA